jgi:hypothetical protein
MRRGAAGAACTWWIRSPPGGAPARDGKAVWFEIPIDGQAGLPRGAGGLLIGPQDMPQRYRLSAGVRSRRTITAG